MAWAWWAGIPGGMWTGSGSAEEAEGPPCFVCACAASEQNASPRTISPTGKVVVRFVIWYSAPAAPLHSVNQNTGLFFFDFAISAARALASASRFQAP